MPKRRNTGAVPVGPLLLGEQILRRSLHSDGGSGRGIPEDTVSAKLVAAVRLHPLGVRDRARLGIHPSTLVEAGERDRPGGARRRARPSPRWLPRHPGGGGFRAGQSARSPPGDAASGAQAPTHWRMAMAPETAAPPRGIRPPSGGGVHEQTDTSTVARTVADGKEHGDVPTAHVPPASVPTPAGRPPIRCSANSRARTISSAPVSGRASRAETASR